MEQDKEYSLMLRTSCLYAQSFEQAKTPKIKNPEILEVRWFVTSCFCLCLGVGGVCLFVCFGFDLFCWVFFPPVMTVSKRM